jgi:hypothetical protein
MGSPEVSAVGDATATPVGVQQSQAAPRVTPGSGTWSTTVAYAAHGGGDSSHGRVYWSGRSPQAFILRAPECGAETTRGLGISEGGSQRLCMRKHVMHERTGRFGVLNDESAQVYGSSKAGFPGLLLAWERRRYGPARQDFRMA